MAQWLLSIRNITKATALKIVRKVCSLPQRRRSRLARCESLSKAGSSNCLFVGAITISVRGITAPSVSDKNVIVRHIIQSRSWTLVEENQPPGDDPWSVGS